MKTRNIETLLTSILFVCFFSFFLNLIYTQNHNTKKSIVSSENNEVDSYNEYEGYSPYDNLTEPLQE